MGIQNDYITAFFFFFKTSIFVAAESSECLHLIQQRDIKVGYESELNSTDGGDREGPATLSRSYRLYCSYKSYTD